MTQRKAGAARPILLVAVAASILVSGCIAPSSLRGAPTGRISDRYSVIVPVQMATSNPRWWLGFHDPVLNRLVEAATTGNLTVVEAKARIREAEADERRAANPITGDARFEVDIADRADSGEIGLSALFDPFGGRRARRAAAASRLGAAQLGEIDARRRLLGQVAESYIELRFTQKSLADRAQDLRSRQTTLRDITTQTNAGQSTELDLLRSRALVADTEVEIPGLEAAILQTRNRLSILTGQPVGGLDIDLRFMGTQPSPPAIGSIGVPADLLRNRPDVRQAEQLYSAAVSDMDAARAARWPRLSLSGVVQAPLSGSGSAETLGAGLILPIFAQPALAAEVDANEARAAQAWLQWRAAVLSAVEEVESALIGLGSSYRAIEAARRVVGLNQESLTLSRRLLENQGNITVLDLLDRERTLTTSRTTLSRNQRDLAVSYVALHVALGADIGEAVRP